MFARIVTAQVLAVHANLAPRWNGHRPPSGELGTIEGLQDRTASMCQIYGPPRFCSTRLTNACSVKIKAREVGLFDGYQMTRQLG